MALALFGGALATGSAFNLSISWWTVDNGGGQSLATGYTLNGTIGQPDAGPLMTGSAYSLSGGYRGISASYPANVSYGIDGKANMQRVRPARNGYTQSVFFARK